MYGVHEKPPYHPSINQREGLQDTHPIASLLDEHLAPLNRPSNSFNPGHAPLLPPINHNVKTDEPIVFPNGDYAVEFDNRNPPFPSKFGTIPPDPLWDDYHPHSQNWFKQSEAFRPMYRGQLENFASGRNGAAGAPKRANGHVGPSFYQQNSPGGSYPSLGYALAPAERLNTPRKSPWQRMGTPNSVASVSTASHASLSPSSTYPGFLFCIYFFLLYVLS